MVAYVAAQANAIASAELKPDTMVIVASPKQTVIEVLAGTRLFDQRVAYRHPRRGRGGRGRA